MPEKNEPLLSTGESHRRISHHSLSAYKEKVEKLLDENTEREVIATWIHYAFIGERPADETALFLMQLMERDIDYNLRKKALKVLINDFFFNDARWARSMLRNDELFRLTWKLLAELKGGQGCDYYLNHSYTGKLIEFAKEFYRTSATHNYCGPISDSKKEKLKERAKNLREYMVEVLASIREIFLPYKINDTDPAMIEALRKFAVDRGHIKIDREIQSAQDVLSFGFKQETARDAAAVAKLLHLIRRDRQCFLRSKKNEMSKTIGWLEG